MICPEETEKIARFSADVISSVPMVGRQAIFLCYVLYKTIYKLHHYTAKNRSP